MAAALTRTTLTLVSLAAAVSVALAACTAPAPATPEFPDPVQRGAAGVYVDPIEAYAEARLSTMTLEQKIASLLMLHAGGTDGSALGGFAQSWQLGGLILMADNIPAPESQLAAMTPLLSAEPGLPILVSIDQEGGTVRRLHGDEWPSAGELRGLPPDAARDAFASRAALLDSMGVSVNFGIVADVTGDTSSFIFDRSMGSTGADAATRVSEAVAGERGLVLSTLKHFPGHGVSPGDSHSSVPSTPMGYDEWLAQHAEPFRAGVAAGAEFVMFGHLQFDAIDAVPATFSVAWHETLRNELAFDGIAVTDDMLMLERSGRPEFANTTENAILALAAGNDMLLYVGPIDVAAVVAGISGAVAAGRISEAAIDESALKVLEARRELSGQTGPFIRCFEECRSMLD